MDATTLAAYRANKDDYLRTNEHSPLPPEQRDGFTGLPYYDWNPDLIFHVDLQSADGEDVTIDTSDGTTRIYKRSAEVIIKFADKDHTLTLFDTGHPGLFLPFRDATSGESTYGGGRYLDLQPDDEDHVTVDFNLAYSPYCAYNSSYSCALPPAENWLDIPIEAGEKTWSQPG